MRYNLYLVFLLCSVFAAAQAKSDITIRFVPTFLGEQIRLTEAYYHLSATDSVVFETIKFYVSGITLDRDGSVAHAEKNSFHLVDLEQGSSMGMYLKVPEHLHFDQISFNLGIDSITNISGALGGDLDPSKGMYWTWQSGYINFKLEGRSNLCATRKNEFHLHLGGYSATENALQRISLKVQQTDDIVIYLPLDKYLSTINLSKQNAVMIPGKQAVELSRIAARLFDVK